MGKRTVSDAQIQMIRDLTDGRKTSEDIAREVGCSPKYVQARWVKENLLRPRKGGPCGENNPAYKLGYRIDFDGYVLVSAPYGYKTARYLKSKRRGSILMHRLMMELKLGRYLTSLEVVDHIDGDKLNNVLSNLRLFSTNAEHLQATLTGKCPDWSHAGFENMKKVGRCKPLGPNVLRVDSYKVARLGGELRSKQMSRIDAEPQIMEPCLSEMRELLATRLHLYHHEKAQTSGKQSQRSSSVRR